MDTISLAGKKFVGVSQALSATQDDFIISHLRVAGLMDILVDADRKKRTPEEQARDLLTQVLLAGKTQDVLAGILTEAGTTWSRSEALRNAELFKAITDPSEKKLMREAIVVFIIGFFSLGERSSESSPKSSNQSSKVRHTKSAAQPT